jgi:L,D-transpeptidase ErfK/SrfK
MRLFSFFLTFLAGFALVLPHHVMAQSAPNKNAVKTASASLKAPQSPARAMIGSMQSVSANQEDTLVHIGRDYGVGFVEMRAANPTLDPWIPGSGAKVIVPTMNLLPDASQKGAVINLAEMRMYIYNQGAEPKTFSIGIGRDGLQTPVGVTKIVRKTEDPTWTPTPRMRAEDPTLPPVVYPGSDNPMGTHALYLGFPNIAIHGTNKPYGIGRRVSSGCIRMFPEDIGRVYNMLPVGTQITVVDQPVKAAWVDNVFYIEASPTQEQSTAMEKEGKIPEYEVSESDLAYIMRKVGNDQSKLDWTLVRNIIKERKGYPIEAATRSGASIPEKPQISNNTTPAKPILKTDKPSV